MPPKKYVKQSNLGRINNSCKTKDFCFNVEECSKPNKIEPVKLFEGYKKTNCPKGHKVCKCKKEKKKK